jgi:mannose-1-phosphate guanylyltransferase
MLNGDVLCDLDLTAQLRQHEQTGARATLALVPVDDPSAYGLVRCNDDLSVSGFVEKPSPDQVDTNLVNAGAYIIEREVLAELAPAGTSSSIERDVFPTLVGRGLFGFEAHGYWLDIGTPDRYLRGTFDILEGNVHTEIGTRVHRAGGVLIEGDADGVAGAVHAAAVVGTDCRLAPDSIVGPRTVLGRGVTVGAGAQIEESVLLDGAVVGAGTNIAGSIIGSGVSVGDHCRLARGVVLGQGVSVGARNTLDAGIRIFPGVSLPDGAIAF